MDLLSLLLLSVPAAALSLGLREKYLLDKETAIIKYRINVNGTRGKSTVTRLLTGALLEAGIPAVGKTSGSKSCLLTYKRQQQGLLPVEFELKRRPEGPNIKEIKAVIQKASRSQAQALVAECMAVAGEYQRVFALGYLKSNITIITNVLEDHLNVLGPSLQDMAAAFMSAVADGSTLIVCPGEHLEYFRRQAESRNIRLQVADPAAVSQVFCRQFSYQVFPENIALALEAAKVMGIPPETALKGMLKAAPDAGALRVQRIPGLDSNCLLIHAFAANDPDSTMRIWNYYRHKKYVGLNTAIIFNCRSDRFERGKVFVNKVLRQLPKKLLILTGDGTRPLLPLINRLAYQDVIDLGCAGPGLVARSLYHHRHEVNSFFGIGNYLGTENLWQEVEGLAGV